jgi:hypothetical protein
MSLRIIAYGSGVSDSQVTISNSEDDQIVSDIPSDILDFIGEEFNDSDMGYRELKVSWNLDVFLSVVLKHLGMKICKELIKPAHEALFSFTDNGVTLYDIKGKPDVLPDGVYDIFYVPSKIFGLQVKGHKSYIYHLEQYFDDETQPDDILGVHAKACDLVDAFQSMGLNPFKLTSPIAIYEASVLNHMDIPTILDLPKDMPESQATELIQWAEQCISLDWLEAYAVGHWGIEESWDYDVQSSFGYQLSKLYNIRYAKFAKSHFMCPDADDGLLKGIVTIYDNVKVHPIVTSYEGQRVTPVGSWPDIRPLNDIRFIQKWGIGEFKLEEGYFWKYTAPVKPFELPLQRIFNLRNKGGLVKKLAKRIGAATWAKMIQNNMDGSFNKHYNPIMASQVVTNARLQVGEFIYQHKIQDNVLHVGIDGVRANKRVGVPEVVKMGEWKKAESSGVIILSPGRVFTNEKKPQGLYYNDILDMIKAHPHESYYCQKLKRRQTLSESIELGDLNGLGKIREFQSTIDLNLARTSQDRVFDTFPRTGQELLGKRYFSEPIKARDAIGSIL